jgi:hypothetical protein
MCRRCISLARSSAIPHTHAQNALEQAEQHSIRTPRTDRLNHYSQQIHVDSNARACMHSCRLRHSCCCSFPLSPTVPTRLSRVARQRDLLTLSLPLLSTLTRETAAGCPNTPQTLVTLLPLTPPNTPSSNCRCGSHTLNRSLSRRPPQSVPPCRTFYVLWVNELY